MFLAAKLIDFIETNKYFARKCSKCSHFIVIFGSHDNNERVLHLLFYLLLHLTFYRHLHQNVQTGLHDT